MPASIPSMLPLCSAGTTSLKGSGTGLAPSAARGSICKGEAKVRIFRPSRSATFGAGALVSTTKGLLKIAPITRRPLSSAMVSM